MKGVKKKKHEQEKSLILGVLHINLKLEIGVAADSNSFLELIVQRLLLHLHIG